MEILQEIWKQNLRPRAVVGYGAKIFLPSPPSNVTPITWLLLRDDVTGVSLENQRWGTETP